MDLVRATGADPKTTARLREDLHLLAIIDARVVREQGAVREYEVRLTPTGHALGALAVEMEREIEKHNKGGR